MHNEWDLTAAEARAVSNLWRLREQLPLETHGAVTVTELSNLLGVRPQELSQISQKARRSMPSTIAISDARLSWLEAETVLAIHSARGSSDSERIPLKAIAGAMGTDEETLYPILRDARERLAAADCILRRSGTFPAYPAGFGVVVGEHPYSWQIAWTVLGLLAILVAYVFWHFR